MSTVISVENVSKLYHIARNSSGATNGHVRSLGETLATLARNPISAVRRNGSIGVEELWALKNINFSVEEGEIVGIIGQNGAGKSTLLKLLSRITQPTTGRIVIKGNVGSLIEVGTGFHPELTGRENVFLNGAILGMKRAEIKQKFDQIVEFSGVEKFLDTAVKHYSSGMYMRLAFSVAAHLEPDILIVDEILSVGDAEFQKKCLGKISELSSSGRTILYVSHSLASVVSLCTRAMLLTNGQKAADGPPAEVIAKYVNIGELPAERTWEDPVTAPGTSRIRLRSVRVLDVDGNVKGTFHMDEPVYVEITYWVCEPGLETNAGYHLYNSQGVLVFISQDLHDKQWFDVPKEVGCYRSIGEIPGKFLNEGVYALDVAVFESPGPITDVFHRQAISFEVVDDFASEVRGRFKGQWVTGVLRPGLQWTTSQIKAET